MRLNSSDLKTLSQLKGLDTPESNGVVAVLLSLLLIIVAPVALLHCHDLRANEKKQQTIIKKVRVQKRE
jgi:hypothetical protein